MTRDTNRILTERLLDLTAISRQGPALEDNDAIVTHIEVNHHHGVGVLMYRLFGSSPDIFSIRSRNYYDGRQEFGVKHVCIPHGETSRDHVFRKVLQSLDGATVRRVLCIPYFPDDALNAIALKEIFGVPLCTYLMDDQNVRIEGIPDAVMSELLAKASLRLAISPELCQGYQQKFGHKMWFLPPLVPSRLIPAEICPLAEPRSKEGVIVGNIWGRRWVDLVRETVRGSGITLRWYNNGEFRWLPCTLPEMARDGVIPQDGPRVSDERLVDILRRTPFAVVPSGILDDTDDRRSIGELSLPSRIPFIFATSHTPILVLGSPETAAARFVTKAGIGMVAPYERRAFQRAVEQMTDARANLEMRRAAFRLSTCFADDGAADWIWNSLARGGPADSRYQELLTA